VREEAPEARFTELFGRLKFDHEVLEWVREALHASHADERREHEEAIKRHQAECKRLDGCIHAMESSTGSSMLPFWFQGYLAAATTCTGLDDCSTIVDH
jgi:hypothetical protein